jgi:hypothetical protein
MTVPRIAMIVVLGIWAGCLDSNLGEVKSVDVPASQLGMDPTFADLLPAPSDGMMSVVVQFFHNSEYVKLSTASLSVNGVMVPFGSMGYSAQIPIVPPGGTITFTHIRAGVTTQLVYRLQSRPTVTSPTANDVLTRMVNFMVMYAAGDGQGVRPLAADATFSTVGLEQTDTGMAFLDVTGLRPGAGSVSVARRYVTSPAGSGFQSVVVTYTTTSLPVPVTWQ